MPRSTLRQIRLHFESGNVFFLAAHSERIMDETTTLDTGRKQREAQTVSQNIDRLGSRGFEKNSSQVGLLYVRRICVRSNATEMHLMPVRQS